MEKQSQDKGMAMVGKKVQNMKLNRESLGLCWSNLAKERALLCGKEEAETPMHIITHKGY